MRSGKATRFGRQPKYGEAVVRLRRGQAPQYGQVELLNPADGELVGRFAIGQLVRIAPGRWPLRVLASDGQMIPYSKPLVVREGGQETVDLQRQQSRLRVTLTKGGQRARGVWQALRAGERACAKGSAAKRLISTPAPGPCASSAPRARRSRSVVSSCGLGADLEEEILCN